MNTDITKDLVIVRGGGDIATGAIQKLYRAGIRILVLETGRPTAIRRTVSLCRAVTESSATVEDMTARLIKKTGDCEKIWESGEIPLLVDPNGDAIRQIKPDGIIDAILAKRNLGTSSKMAPVVVAMGPGFCAPRDAHAVIETMRGHTLGTVIFEGLAIPNTGTPGIIAGRSAERVCRAPCDGIMENLREIGDIVKEGDDLFRVAGMTVKAQFDGVLRGLIENGMPVTTGFKVADVDPRIGSDCNTISDKARALGGAVLEAYLYLRRKV